MGIIYRFFVSKDIEIRLTEFKKEGLRKKGLPKEIKDANFFDELLEQICTQVYRDVYENIKRDFGYRINNLERQNNDYNNYDYNEVFKRLHEENKELRDENKRVSERLEILERKVNSPRNFNNKNTDYASAQELKQKVSDLEYQLDEMPKRISEAMQKMQSAYEERIKQLEQAVQSLQPKTPQKQEEPMKSAAKAESFSKDNIAAHQSAPKNVILPWEETAKRADKKSQTAAAAEDAESADIAVQPHIAKFNLPKTNAVFLPKDEDGIKKALQRALDLDDVIGFLQKSKLESRDAFLRIIEKYKSNLSKAADKFKFDSYDEEEVSEAATEKFFKVVQVNLLNALAVSVYRGMNSDEETYAEFAKKLNAYLTKCGIYTRYIKVGGTISAKDYDDMNIIRKNTDKRAEDRIIAEVERLPYYINYIDEDDEIEQFCYDGSMTVLVYGDK